jgi:hypothetical protein
MFGAGEADVTCIACGAELPRSDAREYDKHGDRWTREGKSFEYLCKPCFRALTKHARDGLEDVLDDVAGRGLDQEAFVEAFVEATRRTAERE